MSDASRRMKAASCFETAASPPPQHEERAGLFDKRIGESTRVPHIRLSSSARAEDPVNTERAVITGSSAFADDDGRGWREAMCPYTCCPPLI